MNGLSFQKLGHPLCSIFFG